MLIKHAIRRRRRRVEATFIALVQIGAFGVLSLADALLDAHRIGLPVHVESPENRACAAQHSHLVCQLVRSMVSAPPADPDAVAEVPAPAAFTTERPGGDIPPNSATFLIGAIIPRGPPLA